MTAAPEAPLPAGTVSIPVGEHFALIDKADAELVAVHRWRPMESQSGRLYAYTVIGRKTVFMHRLILGTGDGFDTDRRNRDGLDNRRCNLRPATRAQNVANTPKSKRRDGRSWTSAYKGVCWNRDQRGWQASIRIDGRLKFLGRFDDEADAARAYDGAAVAAWGEFARLNFPPGT